ncbi:TPA: hypothetical protein N0F65_008897 [Lagenidium giganteum]|uniref:Uncharacterized protein n=1 Tax=Lagenidium giganteum TaxID=4803 RepID=A0AAV2YVH9_9STRA|nr:TPA: hypothetical protein N0F65_008897 [Lagenidium giganteum]
MKTETAERHKGQGVREKFHYYLPVVGRKERIREGNISAKAHGNRLNKHASTIDLAWLVQWFETFATSVGKVVPLCVRLQKSVDGRVTKHYSSEKYTMLPSCFAWDRLYEEMQHYVEIQKLKVREPAPSTMLSVPSPTIRIRSPQSTNLGHLLDDRVKRLNHYFLFCDLNCDHNSNFHQCDCD